MDLTLNQSPCEGKDTLSHRNQHIHLHENTFISHWLEEFIYFFLFCQCGFSALAPLLENLVIGPAAELRHKITFVLWMELKFILEGAAK